MVNLELAVDYGPQEIRANCILLGPIYTPALAKDLTPENRQKRI